MKKYNVVMSKMAARDIQRVRIFYEKINPPAAEKVIERIRTAIYSLADMPLRYPVCSAVPKYRRMVADRFLVFYAVREKECEVLIRRVFDGRMDVARRLRH